MRIALMLSLVLVAPGVFAKSNSDLEAEATHFREENHRLKSEIENLKKENLACKSNSGTQTDKPAPTPTTVKKKAVSAPAKVTKRDKVDEDVDFLLKNGVIEKLNPQMNEAFVNLAFWNGMKIDSRQGVAKTLAVYCGRKKGGPEWVKIKDPYTGKVLAKWGAFGYE